MNPPDPAPQPPAAPEAGDRLERLERQVAQLSDQLEELRLSQRLVADVQRFTPLRQLLAAGRLDEADRETARLLEEELGGGGGEITPKPWSGSPRRFCASSMTSGAPRAPAGRDSPPSSGSTGIWGAAARP